MIELILFLDDNLLGLHLVRLSVPGWLYLSPPELLRYLEERGGGGVHLLTSSGLVFPIDCGTILFADSWWDRSN